MEAQIVSPGVVDVEVLPETSTLINQALMEIDRSKDIVILTSSDYSFANLVYKEMKKCIEALDDEEKKITKPLLKGLEAARAFFRIPKQMVNSEKDSLNQRMVRWTEDQETKRREEEKRLQAEARKRAEEEALRQALEAEALGEKEEAEAILSEPVYVPPIKVVSEIPRSKGTYVQETWSAEIFDLPTLILGIASGKVSLVAAPGAIYSNADDLKKWAGQFMTHLNGKAQSYKQALSIPGVRAVSKKTQI